MPVILRPIVKARPWGGRRLAELFKKGSAGSEPAGESWELVDLPPDESVVAAGPLAGRTLRALMHEWGEALMGGVQAVDGRFPLLVKFIDARESLSIQVHPGFQARAQAAGAPEPVVGAAARPKSEAWYILEAADGAELYIGLAAGVTRDDVRRAAGTGAIVELLRRWPARPGRCFYVPGGTPHAIGAGVVLAEIQTPSDTTYRLYDWERRDATGRPRDLHVDQALAALEYGTDPALIAQPRRHVSSVLSTATRAVACEHFTIEVVRMIADVSEPIAFGDVVVWVILSGQGAATCAAGACPFTAGDVMLLPAGIKDAVVRTEADCVWLEVKIPVRSSLAGYARPAPERAERRGGTVPLTRPGRPGPDGPRE